MKILFVTMQYGGAYRQGTERYIRTLGDALRDRGHEVGHLVGDPLNVHAEVLASDPVETGDASAMDRPGAGAATGQDVSAARASRGSPGKASSCERGGRSPRPRALGDPIASEDGVHAYPTRGWMTVRGFSPRRLVRWLRRHRPDVVHLNHPAHIGVGVVEACRRLGIPVVVTVHDHWWTCPKATLLRPDGSVCDGTPGWSECIRCIAADHHRPVVRRMARLPVMLSPLTVTLYFARALARGMGPADMVRWLGRRPFLAAALNAADHLIFPSRAMGQQVTPALRHDRWRVIPNGLPASSFRDRPPARPAPLRRPPHDLTIGYAGALLPHKAPDLLMEAVRQLGWHDTRIRLAGPTVEPPYLERLRHAARGLKAEFCGRIHPERMPDFLADLDLLVVPSTCPENSPYVVIEAHAVGVAVIASRIGGLIEQVGDERMLFEPGDVGALAACLRDWAGREAPPELPPVPTVERMAEAVIDVYERCVSRRDAAWRAGHQRVQ